MEEAIYAGPVAIIAVPVRPAILFWLLSAITEARHELLPSFPVAPLSKRATMAIARMSISEAFLGRN
jgi:hypothetical protein